MRVEPGRSNNVILPEQSSGPKGGTAWLSVGEVVEALVLEKGKGGALLVEIGGRRLWASSSIAAQEGEVLTLHVDRISPQLTLRSIEPLVGTSDILLALCLKKGLAHMSWDVMGQLLEEAQQWMEQSGIDPGSPLAGSGHDRAQPWESNYWDLGRLLRASGLFLEAKLRQVAFGEPGAGPILPDLKAQLLGMAQKSEPRSCAQESFQHLLDTVRGAQCLALVGQEHEAAQLPVILPPWWMPEKSWGDLRIRREGPGRSGSAPRGWCVTLRLETEDMGRILARLHLVGGRLGCELRASRQEMLEQMEKGIASLRDRLAVIWPSGVQCSVGPLDENQDWAAQGLELPGGLVGMVA
jgi:hypothetical protein